MLKVKTSAHNPNNNFNLKYLAQCVHAQQTDSTTRYEYRTVPIWSPSAPNRKPFKMQLNDVNHDVSSLHSFWACNFQYCPF